MGPGLGQCNAVGRNKAMQQYGSVQWFQVLKTTLLRDHGLGQLAMCPTSWSTTRFPKLPVAIRNMDLHRPTGIYLPSRCTDIADPHIP